MNKEDKELMQYELEQEERWHPLNKVTRPDTWDKTIEIVSWILAGLFVLCGTLEIIHYVR